MKILPAALLALALASLPTAAHAGQPATGAVVAATDEYLVIDTAERGRRLFVLDESSTPAGLRAGERVAIAFVVGDDNELHARAVERVEASEAARRPGLGAVLAALAAGPAGLALVPLLGG